MSDHMPPMKRSSFFLPEDLKDRAQAEAEAEGTDFSEYVRVSLQLRLAWNAALRVIRAGGTDQSADIDELIRRLERISHEDDQKPPR